MVIEGICVRSEKEEVLAGGERVGGLKRRPTNTTAGQKSEKEEGMRPLEKAETGGAECHLRNGNRKKSDELR